MLTIDSWLDGEHQKVDITNTICHGMDTAIVQYELQL